MLTDAKFSISRNDSDRIRELSIFSQVR